MHRNLIEKLFNLVFPEDFTCALCDEECAQDALGVCPDCAKAIRRCDAVPQLLDVDGARSGILYAGPVQGGMYRFKYHGARYLVKFFVQFMEVPDDWRIDAIVPVPLYAEKERVRGYNQCMLLAKALSIKYHIPVRPDLLIRVRDTEPQFGLSPRERAQNVKGAFRAHESSKGLSLLIVDDIYTTGSTLGECAKVLKDCGAHKTYALTACFTPESIQEE